MKAIQLVRNSSANTSFKLVNLPDPQPAEDEILIKVSCFGLNFADVMIRRGLYDGAPKLPSVIGFDAVGTVESAGINAAQFKPGDRVLCLTRFGAYAEYLTTKANAAVLIPSNISNSKATALATQYCTAYYAAAELVQLHAGDHVLIQAGAGGLGTALIQWAKHKDCIIYATAGSDDKITYLKSIGVDHPINYKKFNFVEEIKKINSNKGIDVIFDGIGGSGVRKGISCLASGGRMVCHGASGFIGKNLLQKLTVFFQFGLYHPVQFMMPSKSLIGINMMCLANDKPEFIQYLLQQVMHFAALGVFDPMVCAVFPVDKIAEAHDLLEHRKSIGKIAVEW